MRKRPMRGSSPRKTYARTLVGVSLIAAAAVSALLARPAQAAEHPDFSGLWAKTTDHSVEMAQASPMTPEGKALFARNKKAISESDPSVYKGLDCMPPGFPRSAMAVHPTGIFQSSKALVLTSEGIEGLHTIFFDIPHRPGIPPQIEGDAVGHWEGDTLVADVTNIYDGTFMEGTGIPQSKALHIVQRLRLVDGGKTLEETLLIEDPAIFTKPWSTTFRYVHTHFRPPEKFCNEARNIP